MRTRNPALAEVKAPCTVHLVSNGQSVDEREEPLGSGADYLSRRITHILRFGNGLDLSGLYSKWTKSKMGFDPALSDEL